MNGGGTLPGWLGARTRMSRVTDMCECRAGGRVAGG